MKKKDNRINNGFLLLKNAKIGNFNFEHLMRLNRKRHLFILQRLNRIEIFDSTKKIVINRVA